MLEEIADTRSHKIFELDPSTTPEFFEKSRTSGLLVPKTDFIRGLGYFAKFSDVETVLDELMANGMQYGGAPLFVIVRSGAIGTLTTIEDSGLGFDFERIFHQFKNSEPYWQNRAGGKGTQRADDSELAQVAYRGNGNIVDVMTPGIKVSYD